MVTTIGAKEGLSHLMWVLVGPGDTALVPSPSYPIHIYAPLFAGADVRHVRLDAPVRPAAAARRGVLRQPDGGVGVGLAEAPGRRVLVPAQPDHRVRRPGLDGSGIVEFAREHEIVLVHDFAYADIAFDGYTPPSILQVPGAKDVAVELYTLTKSLLDGRLAGGVPGRATPRSSRP